jgi:hypothetical protein
VRARHDALRNMTCRSRLLLLLLLLLLLTRALPGLRAQTRKALLLTAQTRLGVCPYTQTRAAPKTSTLAALKTRARMQPVQGVRPARQ